MKYFLILAVSILSSCTPQKHSATLPVSAVNIRVDTVFIVRDSIIYVPVFDYELKNNMMDEMNALRDSLFIARYRIERVRYYVKIVKRNKSQIKFLVGWINRAVQ